MGVESKVINKHIFCHELTGSQRITNLSEDLQKK